MATLEHYESSNDISFALGVYPHSCSGGKDLSRDYIGNLHALYCSAYRGGQLAQVIRYFRRAPNNTPNGFAGSRQLILES